MDLYSEQYPYLFFRGRATTFTRSCSTRESYFGGPGRVAVRGSLFGPYQLHHLSTISTEDLGIENSRFGYDIPFYYGMCFEGCELTYKLPVFTIEVACARSIEVVEIDPNESSNDWPYPGYPQLLPYFPLEIRETVEMSLESFSENVMQGVKELGGDELILVVPPNSMMGVSLWGPSGDAEDVQVIFIYDTKNGTVRAYNACT